LRALVNLSTISSFLALVIAMLFIISEQKRAHIRPHHPIWSERSRRSETSLERAYIVYPEVFEGPLVFDLMRILYIKIENSQ